MLCLGPYGSPVGEGGSQMRVGFPKLRKEWEKELPEAELPEEASSSEEDKLG